MADSMCQRYTCGDLRRPLLPLSPPMRPLNIVACGHGVGPTRPEIHFMNTSYVVLQR